MFDDNQTMQLFDRFHEKLHEVSSSSKLESCLRVQKLGAQPRGHNIFKAAHVIDLKNVFSTAFSTRFILVPVWGKARFLQTGTSMKRVENAVEKTFFTMAPPTKTLAAPGKPSPPHQVCAVSLGSLHCVHCKKTGCFCSQNRREKSIFECTIGAARFFCCVVFPTNECNDGHPYLRQWLLLVLVPMIVYIAKRLIILVPKSAEKSPFLNVRGAISAVSFSLRTSTIMSIHAFGKDCCFISNEFLL